jgi:hypothetical protein
LKRFYSKPEHAGRCTYISPPLGGYTEHISGCEAAFFKKPRPSIWNERWASTGTRVLHCWQKEPPEKWFMSFGTKGGSIWLEKVDVEQSDDVVAWCTFWAVPDDRPATDEKQTKRSKRLKRQQMALNEKWRKWVPTREEAFQHWETCVRNVCKPTAPRFVTFWYSHPRAGP